MPALKSTLWSDEFKLSTIPQQCLNKSVWVGIDEAGRGPVIGISSLFATSNAHSRTHGLCCCLLVWRWEWRDLKKRFWRYFLFENDFIRYIDSKALTAEQREKLKNSIDDCESIGYVTRVLSAQEISADMLQAYFALWTIYSVEIHIIWTWFLILQLLAWFKHF